MTQPIDKSREKTYRQYLRGELDAAASYRAMAAVEADPKRAGIFEELASVEMRHASRWAEKLGIDPATLVPSRGGVKLGLMKLVAARLGTNRVIPWLLRGEDDDINTYAADPEAMDFVADERSHGRQLRAMSGQNALMALRAESGHATGNGGSLRAAVLGVNDGLVSNFSLVMGVAGGTGRDDFILLAGTAGLLAGAFSMAAGEYVSMRSQRDVYEYQIQIERAELEESPEEEQEELVLIYQAKGLEREDAERIAEHIMQRPDVALDTMVREELGLDPDELGSPWGAAASSFFAFIAGAIVPIISYIVFSDMLAFVLSGVLSALALIVVGGALGAISGRSVMWAAMRMLLVGGAAAAVTYGIGKMIGISVAG